MFDASAIDAIQLPASIAVAQEAINDALKYPELAHGSLALPASFNLHDLEPRLPQRRRQRGHMDTQALKDFAAYTRAHKEPGATCFVNGTDMTAT